MLEAVAFGSGIADNSTVPPQATKMNTENGQLIEKRIMEPERVQL